MSKFSNPVVQKTRADIKFNATQVRVDDLTAGDYYGRIVDSSLNAKGKMYTILEVATHEACANGPVVGQKKRVYGTPFAVNEDELLKLINDGTEYDIRATNGRKIQLRDSSTNAILYDEDPNTGEKKAREFTPLNISYTVLPK